MVGCEPMRRFATLVREPPFFLGLVGVGPNVVLAELIVRNCFLDAFVLVVSDVVVSGGAAGGAADDAFAVGLLSGASPIP